MIWPGRPSSKKPLPASDTSRPNGLRGSRAETLALKADVPVIDNLTKCNLWAYLWSGSKLSGCDHCGTYLNGGFRPLRTLGIRPSGCRAQLGEGTVVGASRVAPTFTGPPGRDGLAVGDRVLQRPVHRAMPPSRRRRVRGAERGYRSEELATMADRDTPRPIRSPAVMISSVISTRHLCHTWLVSSGTL